MVVMDWIEDGTWREIRVAPCHHGMAEVLMWRFPGEGGRQGRASERQMCSPGVSMAWGIGRAGTVRLAHGQALSVQPAHGQALSVRQTRGIGHVTGRVESGRQMCGADEIWVWEACIWTQVGLWHVCCAISDITACEWPVSLTTTPTIPCRPTPYLLPDFYDSCLVAF